jgi:hypothetical protein
MMKVHMQTRLLLSLILSGAVAACGGGGGGAAPGPAPAAAASDVASLVPASGMTWATTADVALNVTVLRGEGNPAAGAGVRVFTLTRTSPHDGEALQAPVAVSLLNTAMTDGAGRTTVPLRLPAHLTEVLVVATLADTQAQQSVPVGGGASGVTLTLAR